LLELGVCNVNLGAVLEAFTVLLQALVYPHENMDNKEVHKVIAVNIFLVVNMRFFSLTLHLSLNCHERAFVFLMHFLHILHDHWFWKIEFIRTVRIISILPLQVTLSFFQSGPLYPGNLMFLL
jgi:hypothetical protein